MTTVIMGFSEDTDILTFDGWKLFCYVEKDDRVATLVGNKLMYQKCEITSDDYEGKMYEVSSNQIEMLVTADHLLYVRTNSLDYKKIQANEIYRKIRFYKKNVEIWNPPVKNRPPEFVYENGKLISFKINEYIGKTKKHASVNLDIKTWLLFLGIWYAEGCTLRDDYVSISAHKQRVKDAITQCCQIFGFEIKKYKDRIEKDERNIWNIVSIPLVQYLLPYSVGSTNKSLPDWVWYLDSEYCGHLMQGMLLGDGDFATVKKGRYYTASWLLADDFQRLCLHAGFCTNKCLKSEAGAEAIKKDGSIIHSHTDYYCLSVITVQNEPKVNKYMYQGKPVDNWIEYTGKIYDCNVRCGNNVLYVRRKGFSAWC